jgi:fatty-acyl-CoA synthase
MRATGERVPGWRPQPVRAGAIAELLRDAATRCDTDALVFPGSRLTYPELEQQAHAMSRSLHGLGVGRGDAVAIFMANVPGYVVALLAAAKLGAVAVPVNGRFKARELRHVIGHSDSRVLVTSVNDGADEEYARVLAEVFGELGDADPERLSPATAPALRTIVNLGARQVPGMLSAEAFAAAGEAVASGRVETLQCRVQIRDPALLMYTSGTTALPKGCLITHEAIVRQAMAAGARAFDLAPGESFWNPLPLFHTGGLMPLIASLDMRTAFCHPGHFEPGAALEMIEREHCAVLYVMFDTIWVPILDHPRFASTDLSRARAVYLVGPPDRMRWFQRRTPEISVVSAFGMTEVCAHLAVAGPHSDERTRLTTAGHVQPELEARIVDPATGAPQPSGVPGELLYRGPFLFEGYYKQPELTAEAIDEAGWFHSGDLGELDDEGRFTFRGRLKDMLKVGGENVSPLEIEAHLAAHPSVAIAQVVSAPDARYAEVAAAYVQLRAGATVTEDELIDHCRGAIATFKVPRYVRFVQEWPMSGTKIQKFALRERIAAELDAAGITEAPRISSDGAGPRAPAQV